MSNRMQQGTGEERIVAKSRPTLSLVSNFVASSSTAQSSSASNVPGILKATRQNLSLKSCAERLAAQDSNQKDAASGFQMWQSNAKTNESAGTLAAAETNQSLDFQASVERLSAEGSGIVDVIQCGQTISRVVACVPHLRKVYTNLRLKSGQKSGDDMNDFDVNSLFW